MLTPSQWVLKPENSLVWHNEVMGWINKYSGISKDLEDVVDGIEVELRVTSKQTAA